MNIVHYSLPVSVCQAQSGIGQAETTHSCIASAFPVIQSKKGADRLVRTLSPAGISFMHVYTAVFASARTDFTPLFRLLRGIRLRRGCGFARRFAQVHRRVERIIILAVQMILHHAQRIAEAHNREWNPH